MDPDPTPEPTPFFSNYRHNTISSVLKVYFVMHYFSLFKTFMRKGKDPDPDPYLWLMDPDPGGSKTCGSRSPKNASSTGHDNIWITATCLCCCPDCPGSWQYSLQSGASSWCRWWQCPPGTRPGSPYFATLCQLSITRITILRSPNLFTKITCFHRSIEPI